MSLESKKTLLMFGIGKKKWPEMARAEIGGQVVDVTVKVRANARNYRLTIAAGGQPVLSVPPHGRWAEAEGFLRRHEGWLESRLKRLPKPILFRDGAIVPVRGQDHLIVMNDRMRGRVEVVDETERLVLLVPGGPNHMARRLTDWLKAEAEADLHMAVEQHAAQLDVTPSALRIRGQSSRWGSCSSQKVLNFNWRLILAPHFVLDYVAAHEVAHIVEMNHSAAFWATVKRTLPDMDRGRAWLRAHGQDLMAIGRS